MIWAVSLFNIAIFGWTTFETLCTVEIIDPTRHLLPFVPTLSVPALFLLWLIGNFILWVVARHTRRA